MDSARELLDAERDEAVRRLAALTGSFDDVVEAARGANNDDEHDPEGATIGFERAQVAALVLQTRRHLAEVDAALSRLDAGRYGTCEVCGRSIPQARLQARPVARTCVECVPTTR